jgi:hypothetical protein
MTVRPLRSLAAGLTLIIVPLLTACGGDKATPATPTATAAASFAAGSAISDGICRAVVPDDWVSDGAGRGSTPSGARFALFGGMIASDESWQKGASLVETQAAAQPQATVEESTNRVAVRSSDSRSYSVRVRLADRYCDFSLTSYTAIPTAELGVLPAIEASLAAATS